MYELPQWIPQIISVNGEWQEVLIRLYKIFNKDFIQGKPFYKGQPVWWDRRILSGEKYEEGFWHLITKDDPVTRNRLPDFRRAERLPWCAPIIINSDDQFIKVWDYKNGDRKIRTYLWLENLDYVVILEKRKQKRGIIAFLITAYHIGGNSQRRTLKRKYEKRCL